MYPKRKEGVGSEWDAENGLPPPERDSASLKNVRYGPGHEKYPSWPIPATPASSLDSDGDLKKEIVSGNNGSCRSKSWTEETDYPKERIPSYARPFGKRTNQAYTQQLKTVVEKCERISRETYDNYDECENGNGYTSTSLLPPPLDYSDMSYQLCQTEASMSLSKDKDYTSAPSPPQRDISHSDKDLDHYTKKYEDQPLTQYAQSEGYHSYMSSECSSYMSTGTPFLDQLRRESESNQPFWPRDSSDENETFSGMNSYRGNFSTDTIGSVSPLFTTDISDNQPQQIISESLKFNSSNLSDAAVPTPGSISSLGVGNIEKEFHSLDPVDLKIRNLKKFPLTTYTRPRTLSLSDERSRNHSGSLKLSTHSLTNLTIQTSPIIDTTNQPSVAQRIMELEQQTAAFSPKLFISTTQPQTHLSNSSLNNTCQHLNKSWSLRNVRERKGDIPSSSSHVSDDVSLSNVKGCQTLWNGFSPTEYQNQNSRNPRHTKDSQVSTHYTYLDPEKRHKVTDMTLKAIQKKALLAYYERHRGKGSNCQFDHSIHTTTNSFQNPTHSLHSPTTPSIFTLSRGQIQNISSYDIEKEVLQRRHPTPSSPDPDYNYNLIPSSLSSHSPLITSHADAVPPTHSIHQDSRNKSDKMEVRRFSGNESIGSRQLPNSTTTHDENRGESGRMVYMSTYVQHLQSPDSTNRRSGNISVVPTIQSWSGESSLSTILISTTTETFPIPPQRPPKKPHLRNILQQIGDPIESAPPPPLPRSPVRPPMKRNYNLNSSKQSPPPLPSKTGVISNAPTSSSPQQALLPMTEEKVFEIKPCSPLPSSPTVTQVNNTLFNSRSFSNSRLSNGNEPLPADSVYFTTSECKAKFLTQYVNDMQNESISHTDSQDLDKQKEKLVSRISRKLEILRIEQSDIRDEITSNEILGRTVVERVRQTAKRNEFDKFKLHVEEIEKITSLLLGLSGRLARAENALMGLSEHPNPPEKKTLESKRDKLKEQLDEAKVLKENIDRRSAQVSGFLQTYLTSEEFADYHHFTKMKAKLIIDARDIDDKIKLGEEQMVALEETVTSGSGHVYSESCVS